MDVFVQRCAGVDIGKADLKVCVRTPGAGSRRRSEVRTFSTMSAGILECRQWLAEHQVSLVGMEATGDYWKPVYYLLEDQFEVWLLNARHLRTVPGRKTDVNDATWIAKLVEHGLVRPSFVPTPPMRRLRDLTRYRASLVAERSRELCRLEKILEDAGIKLTVVTSKTLSKSSRDMIEALIAGERDPRVLAEFARGRMRGKLPQLRDALVGRFTDHHALLCRTMLDRIDHLDATMNTLSARIDEEMAPFRTHQQHLITIPGISHRIAEIIIAEIGVDMTRFPTPAHLVSWAAVCPGNNESAGKHHSGRTRKGDTWLRAALGEAAIAASISHNTYLAARYRRLAKRRGSKRALVAVSHTILTAIWHMITNDTDYTDLGTDHYERHIDRPRQARRLTRQLTQLGYRVTLEDAA